MSQAAADTMDNTHAAEHGGHHGEHHVLPYTVYFAVYGSLLVLTGITVLVSFAGLGKWSIPVAMAVAVVKASLVVGYFMHLKYDDRLNSLILVVTLLFILIFFAMTFSDMRTRGMIDPVEDNMVLRNEQAAEKAAAAEASGESSEKGEEAHHEGAAEH
ncbi:MAG: cytochrome C oxidase subunit IV family protein [Deltaproteobacteria bacterium]|nr:cytochrome C oxidase subunit IV family protein [Deltaproteobacteria bacterium]MCB9489931.1 cytochrome C oxidase subunit IV family protein [Deltaproteobacteria bacterium]